MSGGNKLTFHGNKKPLSETFVFIFIVLSAGKTPFPVL